MCITTRLFLLDGTASSYGNVSLCVFARKTESQGPDEANSTTPATSPAPPTGGAPRGPRRSVRDAAPARHTRPRAAPAPGQGAGPAGGGVSLHGPAPPGRPSAGRGRSGAAGTRQRRAGAPSARGSRRSGRAGGRRAGREERAREGTGEGAGAFLAIFFLSPPPPSRAPFPDRER